MVLLFQPRKDSQPSTIFHIGKPNDKTLYAGSTHAKHAHRRARAHNSNYRAATVRNPSTLFHLVPYDGAEKFPSLGIFFLF